MKLSAADLTEYRLKFNSHKVHNPCCDILELKTSRDSFITYCIDLNTGNESMEYYSGKNYVLNSTQNSTSKHYEFNKIPKKYTRVFIALREYYLRNYKNS